MSKPVRKIPFNSTEARINMRRQKILASKGYNVKVNGSWGPWQQQLWDQVVQQDPLLTRRVNISNVTTKENRDRYVPTAVEEQLQDSMIGRVYPYALRLALLGTSLQEVGPEGAASIGVGGNGLLGLSKERMPVELLGNTPEAAGKQIKFILDDLEQIIGAPNNNWTSGNNQPPKVNTAQEGFDRFWNATNPYDAAIYLNKCYIRPRDGQEAWKNRADIANMLQNK